MFRYCEFIRSALDYCIDCSKDYNEHDEVIACLKTYDNMIHSKFRYSIAKDIARFLYSNYHAQIKSLRLYGSTMEYTAGKFSDIDIIIRVEFSSENLCKSLKDLDKQLCKDYYRLLSEEISEYSYFIDPHIINDDPANKALSSMAYLEYIVNNDSVELLPTPA